MMMIPLDNPYSAYIGSAYIITLLSGSVFAILTILKLRAIKKRVKRLEQASRHNDR